MKPPALKKRRVSKKSKLSWRKHVNISDVEEFLEEKRLEERLGPPIDTVPNDELFKIDIKPSNEPHLTSKAKKRLKLLNQPIRSFAVLEPHTKVPDPIKKRNRVRTREERKNVLIKKKEAENRAKGVLKHRERQSAKDREAYEVKKTKQRKSGDFNLNVWDSEVQNPEENEWFAKSTIKHNLVGTGQSCKTVKTPKKTKPSVLPAVEVPHPGMSYNPSYTDHQDLLKTIAEKEQKIIKAEEHLDRVTNKMFSKVTPEKRDAMWLEEMSQGLATQDESTSESDSEFKSLNPPTKNKKKTLQQRRKQRELIEQAKQRKAVKLQKKKITDIQQLKILNKQITKKESKSEILREKRKKLKLLKMKEPKQLSATKFEEHEMEFNMGPDISGNLRNLKKEGSLLSERFNSLQKRNILAPSKRHNRKKAKVKVFTKSGHKDDWLTTVAR